MGEAQDYAEATAALLVRFLVVLRVKSPVLLLELLSVLVVLCEALVEFCVSRGIFWLTLLLDVGVFR